MDSCYRNFRYIAWTIDSSEQVASLRNTPYKRLVPYPNEWIITDKEVLREIAKFDFSECPAFMSQSVIKTDVYYRKINGKDFFSLKMKGT